MPGGHQRPKPKHAALWMIVAFCACALMFPAPWVCAWALHAAEPKSSATAVNVIASLAITALLLLW